MARDTSHDFPSRVFVDLVKTHSLPKSKNAGALLVGLDQKLRQNAFNSVLFGRTPYRCSLGRPKESLETRRLRKARSRSSQLECSLPTLSSVRESLVRRNTCNSTEDVKRQAIRDLIDIERDEEGSYSRLSAKTRSKHYLGCDTSEPDENIFQHHTLTRTLHGWHKDATRASSLPLILENGKSTCDTSTDNFQPLCQTESSKSMPRLDSFIGLLEKSSSDEEEFSKVMDDGAKITVNRRKLSIEVFLPRMW